MYSNGSWRSIWNIEFKDDMQMLEVRGRLQVFFFNWFWCIYDTTFMTSLLSPLVLSVLFFSACARINLDLHYANYFVLLSGGGPLLWRGKCTVRCKTWMQGFNNISGYYLYMYKYSIAILKGRNQVVSHLFQNIKLLHMDLKVERKWWIHYNGPSITSFL